MNDQEEKESTCSMNASDTRGDTNLCCCYVTEEDGSYDDPCYQSADDCCCGS